MNEDRPNPPTSVLRPLSSVRCRLSAVVCPLPLALLAVLFVFAPLARAAVQPWAVTVVHVLVLAALVAFALERIRAGRFHWVPTPLDRPLLALGVLCVLSAAFSRHRPSSVEALWLLADYVVVFYLLVHLLNTRDRVRRLVGLLVGVAAFLALFGFFKRLGLNPFPWWDYPDLHPEPLINLGATFGNYNHTAGYFEMTLPLLLGMLASLRRDTWRLPLTGLALVLLAAHVLTLSRGGWAAVATGLLFMGFVLLGSRYFPHKRVLAAGMAACAVLSLVVLSSVPVIKRVRTLTEEHTQVSLNGRVEAWRGARAAIAANPVLGTGPGTYKELGLRYQVPGLHLHFVRAHNDYLEFTAELGLGFVPVAAWLLVAFFRQGFRRQGHPSRLVRGVALGAMTGVVAILVHSVVDFNLQIPANALVFTALAALVAAPVPGRRLSGRGDAGTRRPG